MGRSLLFSFTTGGTQQDYSDAGKHQHPVEAFLFPLELQFKYCGLHYLPPLYSHAMSVSPDSNINEVKQRAMLHERRVKNIIEDFL